MPKFLNNIVTTGEITVGVDDTGHDVKFFGATSGRYLLWDESADSLLFTDDAKIIVGTGGDGEIYSGGLHLTIANVTSDADILFKGNDGGSTITALTLDMSDAGTAIFNHDIKIADDGIVKIGNSTDLYLSHDATNSHIANATGHLKITQNANDKDIIFSCDDGSGGNTDYFFLDGSAADGTYIYTEFKDQSKLVFGNSQDLQIHHSGGISYIENTIGDLTIQNTADDKDIIFQNDDNSGGVTEYLRVDGSSERLIFTKVC